MIKMLSAVGLLCTFSLPVLTMHLPHMQLKMSHDPFNCLSSYCPVIDLKECPQHEKDFFIKHIKQSGYSTFTPDNSKNILIMIMTKSEFNFLLTTTNREKYGTYFEFANLSSLNNEYTIAKLKEHYNPSPATNEWSSNENSSEDSSEDNFEEHRFPHLIIPSHRTRNLLPLQENNDTAQQHYQHALKQNNQKYYPVVKAAKAQNRYKNNNRRTIHQPQSRGKK